MNAVTPQIEGQPRFPTLLRHSWCSPPHWPRFLKRTLSQHRVDAQVDGWLMPWGYRAPKLRRVGFRIALFEACLAFTTRYGLHTCQVTIMTFYTRGFDCFVSSTATPIATGWSDSCRVGIAPTEEPRLFTAH